jgi:hypothetical protein
LAKESIHYLRVKWIFERIHFDRTPIDLVFIGTSHTQSGINSERVESALRSNGSIINVVNFAVPHLGRDLQFLLLREAIKHRNVKHVVVELQESEARAPHPGFQHLAPVKDLLQSPLILNTGYFENFSRLPQRQLALFLRSRFSALYELQSSFDPIHYEGPHWDDTYRLHGINTPRLKANSVAELERAARDLWAVFERKQSLARKLTVPTQRYSLLERYNQFYLEEMLTLASRQGVGITFLYLPFFRGPENPKDYQFLASRGPILSPTEVLADPSSWQNVDHLNFPGANSLSDWVGNALSRPNVLH